MSKFSQRKYRIEEFLLLPPHYKNKRGKLKYIVGVSDKQFQRWCNILTSSDSDIPAGKIYLIACFFKVYMEQMFSKLPRPDILQ